MHSPSSFSLGTTGNAFKRPGCEYSRLSLAACRRRCDSTQYASAHKRSKILYTISSVHCSSGQDGSGHSSLLPHQRALSIALGEAHTANSALSGSFVRVPVVKSGKRLRVAVDVDEVLGRFVHALNMFVKETYGKDHAVDDFFVYEFAKIWKCSNEESRRIVHEFFESGHFQGGIPVIPGAYEALSRLSQYCDLVVVTSRQHAIEQHTIDWVNSNFPGIFSDIHFGNHWALSGASRKKSEICRSIGADILIDDNPVYALECAEEGIQVLLYDWDLSYPWSKLPAGCDAKGICVVKDWKQVEDEICRVLLESVTTQSVS